MKKKRPLPLILVGDVGGTKTLLGLCHMTSGENRILATQIFESKAYGGLEEIITEFLLERKHPIAAACFGVAGPVVRGAVITTNLAWKMSELSLANHLNIKKIALINDLVANAYGIGIMQKADFISLNQGKKTDGNAALLSAGTGLGESILFWDGTRHIPTPSEGGHVDFGPKNSMERELLTYLSKRFDHVSYERLLSGSGLVNIYHFLKDSAKFGTEPAWLAGRMEKDDPAAVITEMARLKKSRLCDTTLDVFVSIYGSAAGNLALQVMATAGMFLGGGIAPKIIWKLRDGTFMKAFADKGRLSHIVNRIPVKVIMNDRAALFGAAAYALQMMKQR